METWSMLTEVTVAKSALQSNVGAFRTLCPKSRFMAVVKSNAYGHGLPQVVDSLAGHVDWWGVNSAAEAAVVHSRDSSTPILVMGRVDRSDYSSLPGTAQMVLSDREEIRELGQNRPDLPFHLKIDTGMSRLGSHGEALDKTFAYLSENPALPWTGLMTHFANVEDVTDQTFALEQLRRFSEAQTKASSAAGKRSLIRHASASSAALILPQAHLDMVRVGISLYGFWPSVPTRISALNLYGKLPVLKPALTWKTKIVHLNTVAAGSSVGYGCTIRVPVDTRIAVLPVGYFEGYDRNLSNRSHVLIRGKRARLLGRVCMNMIMVDVSHINGVASGDEAVLIGQSGDEQITAEELADLTGTIQYETVSRIQSDIPRVLV